MRKAAAAVGVLARAVGNVLVPAAPDGPYTDVVELRRCPFDLLSDAAKPTERGRPRLSAARSPASR